MSHVIAEAYIINRIYDVLKEKGIFTTISGPHTAWDIMIPKLAISVIGDALPKMRALGFSDSGEPTVGVAYKLWHVMIQILKQFNTIDNEIVSDDTRALPDLILSALSITPAQSSSIITASKLVWQLAEEATLRGVDGKGVVGYPIEVTTTDQLVIDLYGSILDDIVRCSITKHQATKDIIRECIRDFIKEHVINPDTVEIVLPGNINPTINLEDYIWIKCFNKYKRESLTPRPPKPKYQVKLT